MSDGIIIAGGGLVAQRAAETLRRSGHTGPVRIVCAEPHLPYDRPPLSKEVLSGEHPEDQLAFSEPGWYAEQSIDIVSGVAASGLRADVHRLELADGRSLRYDRLLIATGSRPRRLAPLAGYENVHELRTLDDTVRLRAILQPGTRLAILGAGFIGLEVAATARRLGAEVTLVEAAPSPLGHILGEEVGDWFADLHRSEGVEVLTGRTVGRIHGGGRIGGLTLSDGTRLDCDELLVGVGVEPDVGWLAGSPLSGSGGVPVDAHGRSVVPDVFAAGDVAATFDPRLGSHRPGSHWEAAGRQARRAARLMLGLDPGEVEPASFWTDQYGIRIQYLGQAPLADASEIDGDPAARDFAVTYMRAGRPVAGLLVGRPRALPAMRTLINQSEGATG